MIPKRVMICGYHPKYGSPPGGPANYCGNLTDILIKTIKVLLLIPSKKYEEIHADNLLVVKMGGNPVKRRFLKYYKNAWRLRKEYDLIHFMEPNTAFGFQYVNKIIRKPMVITFHGYLYEKIKNDIVQEGSFYYKFLQWMEKKTIQRADVIITAGNTLRKWLIHRYNVSPEKIYYIPNGVDVNNFNFNLSSRVKVRNKLNIKNDKTIILFSKYLDNQNGIIELLEAMNIVSKEFPNAVLLILGSGPLSDAVRAYQKNKLPNNIIYPGEVPHKEVSDYMSSSDIFVLPSSPLFEFGENRAGEVCPLSIREAMACGLPVVATDVAGNTELLEEGKAQMKDDIGILVPTNKPQDLADGIIYLLNHPEKRKTIGENAQNYVEKYSTWEKTINKVLQVYDHALKIKK